MSALRDRINARPDLAALVVARELDEIAAKLNAEGLSVVRSRYITMRTISAEIPREDARAIVTALVSAATVDVLADEAVRFLRTNSGYDIGDPGAQEYIDEMAAAGALTADRARVLKGLALAPLTVDRLEVEAAINEMEN